MSPGLAGGSLRATVGAVKPRTDAAAAPAAAADNENNTHTPRAPDQQQHTEPAPLLLRLPLPWGKCKQTAAKLLAGSQPGCQAAAAQHYEQDDNEEVARGGRRMLSLGCMQYQQAAFRAGSWEQLLLFVLLRGSTQCWRHFAVCLSSCNKMASGMLFPLTTMMMKLIIMMMMMLMMMLLTEC